MGGGGVVVVVEGLPPPNCFVIHYILQFTAVLLVQMCD